MFVKVLDVLPHRFPFVMIDRVVSIEGNDSLTGLKNVSINEPFFTGHFQSHPVMPVSFLIGSNGTSCWNPFT